MSIYLIVSGSIQWAEGSEEAYFLAGLPWGFTEATDKAPDTWQTFIRRSCPYSLAWKAATDFLADPNLTMGPSQQDSHNQASPVQWMVSDPQEVSTRARSCLDQISPGTFYLIFTSPLSVTETCIWQHWDPQSKAAFSSSQGLQQKNRTRIQVTGKNCL